VRIPSEAVRCPPFLTEWHRALNDGKYNDAQYVKLSVWHAPGTSRPTFEEATNASNVYEEVSVNQSFGPSWTTHWFRAYLTVPNELCQDGTHVELHWDCGNEATVWTETGEPLQGLTGRGERTEWILPTNFKDGKEHMIYLEMACNGMFGNGPGRPIFKNNASYYQRQTLSPRICRPECCTWIFR